MKHSIQELIAPRKGKFWQISPEATVYQALEEMEKRDVGALVVMSGTHLVGFVSERDYARKVALKGKTAQNTLVSEIMSSPVHTISPTHSFDDAMEQMTRLDIRHLPVVENEKVIAVISIGDVVSACLHNQRETIEFYKDIELDT